MSKSDHRNQFPAVRTRTTTSAGLKRASMAAICFALWAVLSACGVPFQEVELTQPRTVRFIVDSNDVLLNQNQLLWRNGYRSYAPLLDSRRRIVANSWVRSATLRGPFVTDTDLPGIAVLRLAWDECRETELPRPALPCTPAPFEEQDRLEFGWRPPGDFTTILLDDEVNRASARGELWIPVASGPTGRNLSLASPGAELRFVSGPAVPYVPPPSWSSLPTPPNGEGTGFLIDSLELRPSNPPRIGFGPVQEIAPYEQVSGVLLGDGEDSFRFKLQPSENAQSVAIWFQPGVRTSSVTAYARCGATPNHSEYALSQSSVTRSADAPIFLDFESGACTTGWHVVIASEPAAPIPDIVFHFTVAERYAHREWTELKVGIEMPTSGPNEDKYIRDALRLAAWKLYGVTGGTQIIRAFRYDQPGSCSRVHICWRNRPDEVGCPNRSGRTDTFDGSINICWDPQSGMGLQVAAALAAHEFGHAYAGLADEYWKSNDLATICDESGRLIKRCSHSIMSYTWSPFVNSLCTRDTHDAVPEFHIQTALGRWLWDYNVAGPNTISECRFGGPPWVAGAHGIPAWHQMVGIVPIFPPEWSPVNFGYDVFAQSPWRTEIGRNQN